MKRAVYRAIAVLPVVMMTFSFCGCGEKPAPRAVVPGPAAAQPDKAGAVAAKAADSKPEKRVSAGLVAANEEQAQAMLRTIATAEFVYRDNTRTYGRVGDLLQVVTSAQALYQKAAETSAMARDLLQIVAAAESTYRAAGPGNAGVPMPAGFQATGKKDGYIYTVVVAGGEFSCSAEPETPGVTGVRSFGMDANGDIRAETPGGRKEPKPSRQGARGK